MEIINADQACEKLVKIIIAQESLSAAKGSFQVLATETIRWAGNNYLPDTGHLSWKEVIAARIPIIIAPPSMLEGLRSWATTSALFRLLDLFPIQENVQYALTSPLRIPTCLSSSQLLEKTGLVVYDASDPDAPLRDAAKGAAQYYDFQGALPAKFTSLWLRNAIIATSRSVFLRTRYIDIPDNDPFSLWLLEDECLLMLNSMGLSKESCPWLFNCPGIDEDTPETSITTLGSIASTVNISNASIPDDVFHMLCAASSFMDVVRVWRYCADVTGEKISITKSELLNDKRRDKIFDDYARRTGVIACLELLSSGVPLDDLIR